MSSIAKYSDYVPSGGLSHDYNILVFSYVVRFWHLSAHPISNPDSILALVHLVISESSFPS